VFAAIHAGNPDQKLLAYQYIQTLPRIAEGDANKLWIVPSELGDALKGIGGMLGGAAQGSDAAAPPAPPGPPIPPMAPMPPLAARADHSNGG
jgi:hypothetical protein